MSRAVFENVMKAGDRVNRYQRGWRKTILLSILVILLTAWSFPVLAADESIRIGVSESKTLTFGSVERVAIANPAIADVVVASGGTVLIVGKAPGSTSLHIWCEGERYPYTVEVTAADETVAAQLREILGYPGIKVSKVGKTIILEGTVRDQYQLMRAEKLGGAYGDKVVNLLEVTRPMQVKLEAKVVEISKDKTSDLGIVWGNSVSTPGYFSFGQSSTKDAGGTLIANPSTPNQWNKLGTYSGINGQLNLLISNGAAKLLSQPNVVTLSGEKANILVGGEIPVPTSNNNGQVSIEWKDYGIKLDILPEVSQEGLIRSRIKAEVSTLDFSSAAAINLGNGLVVPPLKTRRAESTIGIMSGETMAIGGLLSSEESKNVTKVPLLSDIPVLGHLFKSTSFSRGETEVVILITATIVQDAGVKPEG